MKTLESLAFGSVTVASGDDTYVTREVTLAGRTAPRSLFLEEGLGAERLAGIRPLLDDLETLDARARAALRDALEADPEGTVGEYLAVPLQERPAALASVVQGESLGPGALLAHLELRGVGAHLRPEGFALALDYAPGRDHGGRLLIVTLDPTGTPVGIASEG